MASKRRNMFQKNKTQETTENGLKVDAPQRQIVVSPLKNRLSDNNATKVEFNGLPGDCKLSPLEGLKRQEQQQQLAEPDRYLHKKFKKVATLEETRAAPPRPDSQDERDTDGGPLEQTGHGGRYQCPHCGLVCAKPSVLQKHIRAHTNERPFPCLPCGIAFKTKSNLYKHGRSRGHALKAGKLEVTYDRVDETDGSSPSHQPSTTSSEDDDFDLAEGYRPPVILEPAPQQPSENNNRIYKPKFHKAAFYRLSEESPPTQPPSQELLQARINRLISENRAIVGEPQLKRHGSKKSAAVSPPLPPPPLQCAVVTARQQEESERWDQAAAKESSRLAFALLGPPSPPQPLNLSTPKAVQPFDNPEGSIIKDILLKARSGSQYRCPRCRSVFSSCEGLELHSCLKRSRSGDPSFDPLIWRLPPLASEPVQLTKKAAAHPPPVKVRKLSLEEQPRSPVMKAGGMHLYGGEVHILDNASGQTKTLRIEPGGKQETASYGVEAHDLGPPPLTTSIKIKEPQVLMISKTGLHSVGSTIVQSQRSVSPKSPQLGAVGTPGRPAYPSDLPPALPHLPPPLNPLTSITGFNPLTLPAFVGTSPLSPGYLGASGTSGGGVVTIVHGGKSIRHVPGIPGPVTPSPLILPPPPPLVKKAPPPLIEKTTVIVKTGQQGIQERPARPSLELEELAMKRVRPMVEEVMVKTPMSPAANKEMPLVAGITSSIITMTTVTSSGLSQDQPQDKKFLRPTSLPLRPGTYTPKRHVSLPPQASLISPETPRPRKAYVQLYLNGHAYTYLGLKCSTRMFFCTLNKPQPIYVPLSPEHNKVSMYSNWKVCSESNPNPFGLNPGSAMGHYDSRNRASCYTVANGNRQDVMTHSSYLRTRQNGRQVSAKQQANTPAGDAASDKPESEKYETGTGPGNGVGDGGENNPRRVRVCDGGFESNEDYTYVRGRGRGRYVCEECGIRCKKPSMLKKHIRTHTNLRPYSCKHCAFSFKTKGNLTKHMKSKAHYKKCVELDVPPDLIGIEDEANNLPDEDSSSQNTQDLGHEGSGSGGGVDSEDETEDEDDDEDEDEDTEDEEEGRMRVAARSLLSLSEVTPQIVRRQFVSAGLDSGRPSTYPYILSSKEQSFEAGTPVGIERQRRNDATVVSTLSTLSALTRQHIPHDSADAPKLPHSADVSAVTSKLSEVTIVTPGMTTLTLDSGRPIDLSSKATAGVRTPVITAVSGQASLLATICSTTERLPSLVGATTPTEIASNDTNLLHRYLKERAARESLIKRQQCCPPSQEQVPIGASLLPSLQGVSSDSIVDSSPSSGGGSIGSGGCSIGSGSGSIGSGGSSIGSGGGISSPDVSEDAQLLHRYLKKRSAELANKPETSVETSSPAPVSPPPPPLLEIVCGTSPTGVLHTPVISPPQRQEAVASSDPADSANLPVNPVNSNAKESALGILALTASDAKKSAALQSQQPLSPNKKLKAEFMPPSSGPSPSYVSIMEDGRSMCSICNKVFNKPSQLRLHVNIHYFERPFRCESCAVSFRTKGHLQKHQRSVSHLNKVNMNSTFGAPTTSNPRPFKCDDCKIAFRIHGHLAKHLRSKMHIMKLECLGKLPFGIYAELERSGTNMNDIDTTDCENSLESLQKLAQKLYEKDPSKLGQWTPIEPTAVSCPGGGGTSGGDTDDDDDDRGGNARPPPALQHNLPPRGRFDDGYHHPHHQEDGVR